MSNAQLTHNSVSPHAQLTHNSVSPHAQLSEPSRTTHPLIKGSLERDHWKRIIPGCVKRQTLLSQRARKQRLTIGRKR